MKSLMAFLHKPYIYLFIILFGILLKFYNLENKYFWDDEIATILHTTGISMAEYEQNLPVNTIVNKSLYDNLLKINDKDFGIIDQMIGLGQMPQLTPGHYYFLIFWTRIIGDDYLDYRYFSIFMFILTLPFMFLLGRKIFRSDLTGWIATTLFAVSPFFHFYAQEARYNMLWAFAMIFLHYALLKAIEQKTLKWWAVYSIVGIIALGSNILSGVILLAHLIYYLIYYREEWKPLAYSFIVIFLGCLPWLSYVYIHQDSIVEALQWQANPAWGTRNIITLFNWHLDGISQVFINFEAADLDNILPDILKWLMVIFIIYGFIHLFRNAEKKQLWFIVLISLSGVLVILAVDMIRASIVSLLARYQLLNFAGIILLTGFIFKQLFEKKAVLFVMLFFPLVILGILSSKSISDDACIYKRNDCYYHVEDIPDYFSGEEKILIISDYKVVTQNSYSAFLSIMHASPNENIDILYAKPEFPDFREIISQNTYDKIYAIYLSDTLKSNMLGTFSEQEMIVEKKRKLYGAFDLPVYSINVQPDSTKSNKI